MALHQGEYDPAGPRAEFVSIVDANTQLAEQTRAFLARGLDRLSEREFCAMCPAAVLCAAAEAELNRACPNTRVDAPRWRRQLTEHTLRGMSITTVDRPHTEDVCFGKVVHAIERGHLLEASSHPTHADPLEPGTRQLLWLADRVQIFTRHVAERLASGQY
ncbi:hypothetical protein [Rhodococcus gannanensis]|uniref:DUF222 domain-containing protein n=1 Tax=Rhodococcus gannanensis TaxID=1960308 RepID=A0ABW4P7A1_9NOCA